MAAAAAALPAAAQAGPRFDYRQAFTTSQPGAATGIDTRILYKHPNDPNAKPIPVRQEIFTFPVGTRFDETVVPDCTVSDLELRLRGTSACPAETWIVGGNGNTSMTGFPGSGETPILATASTTGAGGSASSERRRGSRSGSSRTGGARAGSIRSRSRRRRAGRPTGRVRCAGSTTCPPRDRSAAGHQSARRARVRPPACGPSRPA